MKTKWLGVALVAGIAVAIVGLKGSRTASSPAAPSEPMSSASANTSGRSIVLVAPLYEAEDPCVCGKIIRAVRAAGARGVATKEIDPEEKPEQAASYNVRVSPAVLILDKDGKELRRFEGESADTFTRIQADLDHLSAKQP